MGDTREFTTATRLFLKGYRWRRIEPVPWAPLAKPLAESRLALVSSAGLVPVDDEPFDMDRRGGDTSFRVIPADVDLSTLVDCQRSETYDHGGLASDPNLAFPADRLHELVDRGRIGSLTRSFVSFMGSISAPGRLIKETAPEAAAVLKAEGAEVALLVPV